MSALESIFDGKRPGFVRVVRSERFPATHINGDFIYDRYKINRRNVWYFRYKAKNFEDQVHHDEFKSPDEVRHNIRPGVEVILVKPVRGRDIGKDIAIATREMREDVLVTGIVVVDEKYQQKGIGTHLAEDAILRYKPKAGTGRTRKWQVLRTYERLEYLGESIVKKISPTDTNGKLVPEAKERIPSILTPKEYKGLDLETGLYPDGTYPRLAADVKDFRPPKNDPEGLRLFQAVKDLGIDPVKGNGFRYWLEINEEVLEKASAAYNPREVVILPVRSLRDKIIDSILGLSSLANV